MILSLTPELTQQLVDQLGGSTDASARAQARPVHVVYGGTHLFKAGTIAKVCERARSAMDAWAGTPASFALTVGLDEDASPELLVARVREKLARRPVEAMCIDFEDGYGPRPRAPVRRDRSDAVTMTTMFSRGIWALVACGFVACGGSAADRPSAESPSGARGDEQVETQVITEKQPDGSIKKTTIRRTTRTVAVPPPPARPADPFPADPLVKYNVAQVNAYRAQKGLPPLLYDAKISAFAERGSEQLSRDHTAHAHFAAKAQGAPGFGSRAAENQGDPAGVPSFDPDTRKNGQKQIDVMLRLMMDEGPGGGHYDNMMNTRLRRIGIGLFFAAGRLYMTNDFSD